MLLCSASLLDLVDCQLQRLLPDDDVRQDSTVLSHLNLHHPHSHAHTLPSFTRKGLPCSSDMRRSLGVASNKNTRALSARTTDTKVPPTCSFATITLISCPHQHHWTESTCNHKHHRSDRVRQQTYSSPYAVHHITHSHTSANMQAEAEPESDADMHSGSDSTLTELESNSSVRSESDSDDQMQSASASASETEVHPILAFYDSEHKAPFDPEDPETTFEHVMLWTDSELELRHEYIQHLFPIPEVSGANPNAPVLTEEVRDAFIADPDLQENMRRAWVMMMAFFGWELATEEMAEGAHVRVDYPVPRRHFRDLAEQTWLQHSNHNQLRITRIIRSMRILGLYEEAQMMTSALMDADEAAQNVVNAETLGIWFDTSIRPVCYPPMFPKNDVPVCDWLLGLGE